MAASAGPAAMELVTVSKAGVLIFGCSAEGEAVGSLGEPVHTFPAVPTADGCVWSSDGNFLGLFDPATGGVAVLSASEGYTRQCQVPPLIPGPVRSFYFSPLGSFLVTLQHWAKDAGPNVGVWDAKTGEMIFSFVMKKQDGMTWPPLKWTSLETHCCRMVTDGVQIMPGNLAKDSESEGKVSAPGIMAFECAPRGAGAGPPHVAIVIAEAKGAPARCQIFRLDDPSQPTATKNFFKAQSVQMWWNNIGTAVLCKTSQEVDDTGKSYYGGSHLYFLRADGEESCIVAMPDEGAIHDVQWSPTQDEFVLLHGDLPCNVTLHEGKKGSKKMDFNKAHRNTIRWNQFGRFLVTGGYGQLLGDTDFWDKTGKRLLNNVRLETCVMSAFAPDGRHFMAATTSPRMRVDNKIVIYDYCGTWLSTMPFDELLIASWRPRPRGAFQDRPPSPEREAKSKAKAGPKAGGYPGAPPAKAQAYRPPGARAAGGGLAEQLRKELGSTQVQSSGTATRVGQTWYALPPGAGPADATTGGGGGGGGGGRNARKAKAKQLQAGGESEEPAAASAKAAPKAPAAPAAKAPAPKAQAAPSATPPAAASATASSTIDNPEVEKKVKALRKKLRDIAKLKEGDTAKLDPLQREKIATEGDLIQQLAELGAEP